jgi:hypothetical protein
MIEEKDGTSKDSLDHRAPVLDCKSGVNLAKFLLTFVDPDARHDLDTILDPEESISVKGGWNE